MALKIQTGVSDFLIFPIPLTNAHSWLSITGSIITAPAAASWHSVYRISHRTYGTDCAVPEAGGMDIFPDLSIRCWKPHVVVPTFTDSILHIYDDTDRKEHIHYRCRRNSINYISCPTWKQFLAFLFYANELLPLPMQHILPSDDDGSTFSPFTVIALPLGITRTRVAAWNVSVKFKSDCNFQVKAELFSTALQGCVLLFEVVK